MDPALISLFGFAVVMTITPGPNNMMVAASAAHHGVRATLPHMFGIAMGFAFMLVLVGAGLGALLLSAPAVTSLMRWAGAAWMCVIAWKIATAPPLGTQGARPVLGFLGAAAFQWINPKAWMIGVGVVSQFVRPDMPLTGQVARIGVMFLLVAVPCILPWALLGDGAGRLLRAPGRLRLFNLVMAALLLASLVPMLWEG